MSTLNADLINPFHCQSAQIVRELCSSVHYTVVALQCISQLVYIYFTYPLWTLYPVHRLGRRHYVGCGHVVCGSRGEARGHGSTPSWSVHQKYGRRLKEAVCPRSSYAFLVQNPREMAASIVEMVHKWHVWPNLVLGRPNWSTQCSYALLAYDTSGCSFQSFSWSSSIRYLNGSMLPATR